MMKINKQLNTAIARLIDLKCVLPGKVREISVTCGTPGCKCMKKHNPQKHKARQMSYTHSNKTKALSVRKADASKVEELNLNYKKLREASTVFAHEFTEMVKTYGLEESEKIIQDYIHQIKLKSIGMKPEAQKLREARVGRDKWKNKALKRQAELACKAVRVRDVEKSRGNWKKKAFDAREEIRILRKALDSANRKLNKAEKNRDNKKKLLRSKLKKSFL
jgi:hypothetical protein